ncbi:MAG TPA: DUF4157 domain-containing protein, partial [Kofleriaceae bacterium]|nr:DUF4157 domain-containing protein [Kofleriaceae bacterium]
AAGETAAAARQSQMQLRELQPEPVVQRAPLAGEQTSAPNWDVQARGALARSSGAPVDAGIRGAVERHVGADLTGTRVHTGAVAEQAAASVGARAFTYGRDIFVGGGESAGDTRLMAHELSHVVQQHGAEPVVQRDVTGSAAHQPAEAEADRVADAVAKKPEIEATPQALGDHIATGMDKKVNVAGSATSGIHYAHNYKYYFPELWKDDMWSGYANPDFFERVGFMHWVLKPGKSASEGLRAWFAGLTIAECNSSVVALHIDALRAAIGDDKFDDRYGKAGGDKPTPPQNRLRIKPGTSGTPVGGLMAETEAAEHGDSGSMGARPAQRGEWYYFYNHPQYLLKHPGGAWQGENALYMGTDAEGKQLWAGMGASNVTEDGMMSEMVRAYNAERTPRDLEVLEQIKARNGGTLPAEYEDDGKTFPHKIKKGDVLDAPEYTVGGTTRKGGFLVSAGARLDAPGIKKIRDQ